MITNCQVIPFDRHSSEGLFEATAHKNGTYSLIMPNPQSSQKLASFAFQYAEKEHVESHLQPHHFTKAEEELEKVQSRLREIENETTYLWLHQKSHLKGVRVLTTRAWWFAALQFMVLMFMTAFQIYYVRGLISHRKLML